MEKREKFFITLVLVVLLTIILFTATSLITQITGYSVSEGNSILSECLQKDNVEFYYSPNCPECEKQKSILGNTIQSITLVDCKENKIACPNLKSVPALYLNNKIYYGYKDLNELANLVGCNTQNP